ncbi:hypothetical protein ABBQ38_004739 [Trebouxia sp. C0009 RCD-2024]
MSLEAAAVDTRHTGRHANGYDGEERKKEDYDTLVNTALHKAGSKKALLPTKSKKQFREIDLRDLTLSKRKFVVEQVLESEDADASNFFGKLKSRFEKAHVDLASVEVRFKNLSVSAEVAVGARGEPTVLNAYRNQFEALLQKLKLMKATKTDFCLVDSLSGTLRPGRITLLLGPPGAGKSTLLNALAGRLHKSTLKVTGDITYNGKGFDEFRAVHTSSYVDQNDLHQPLLTVKETMDFAARVQGVGHKAEELQELQKREKEQSIEPDWEVDALLKAAAREGKRESIVTDLIIKLLGLDVCADTLIGSDQVRGVSGGQRKRVTTGELLVGPKKVLFLDEISTGLDSSTTFQISRTLRDFCHLRDATMLVALLQPTPETYALFDDILLMSEGKMVYHGPRQGILPFFGSIGMNCPARKADSDFLQEVTSRKDQQQYWDASRGEYKYIPVAAFANAFQQTQIAHDNNQALEEPYTAPNPKCEEALCSHKYALPLKQRMLALGRREFTLVMRNFVVYKAKTIQVAVMGLISATLFLRTHIHPISPGDGQEIAGFLYFSTLIMLFNGIAELTLTVNNLPVFWKQRRLLFFDAFSYSLPAFLLRIPFSAAASLVWTVLTYFPVGLAGEPSRFFMFWALLFLCHQFGLSLYRFTSTIARNIVVANAAGMMLLLCVFLMNGFVIQRRYLHPWVLWIYWMNPLNYIQRAILVNEFTAHHWQGAKVYPFAQGPFPANTQSLGDGVLHQLSQTTHYWWCWLAIGVCIAYIFLLNVLIVIFLTILPAYGSGDTQMVTEEALAERKAALEGDPGSDSAVKISMPQDAPLHSAQHPTAAQQPEDALESKLSYPRATLAPEEPSAHQTGPFESPFLQRLQPQPHTTQHGPGPSRNDSAEQQPAAHGVSQKSVAGVSSKEKPKGGQAEGSSGMVLPFDPMTMTFKDLHYFVPIPKEAAEGKAHVHTEGSQAMLELLLGISGAFRPGVLTCLMGVSGAGKTTLMDVLAGRKTSGKIEGDIRINGHPKEQQTFARVSGYVEQFDTHTAASTVYESLLFSGTLRNGKDVDAATTKKFVDQVLGLVELQTMRNAVVGRPGESGLSVEQRKRLTIAVELVANPAIVFMDEPTSGLDARAAAIVMRTVRNIVNTGRTIVCTIHQPSIDIFESFDELLLLKRGGETIFNGQLGHHSSHLIDYFQGVKGAPAIEEGMNPATWMLEVTTPGMESKLGISFAEYYASSDLAKHYANLLEDYSSPVEGSKQLKFDSQYPKPMMTQFWAIFAKYTAAYWRMPEYNGTRLLLALGVGFTFGAMFWRLGDKVTTQGGLTNVLGALYATTLFFSIINATVIQPVVFAERAVSYRERAAGTYSVLPWVMALGCVEIIYVLIQGTIYCSIVYWMCWFQRDAGKFFWFVLFNLLTLIYFTFFGMLCVALTPTLQLAAVCSAYVYSIFNLFAGFAITQPQMPGWWIWMSYLNPIFWSVYGLIISQVGNLSVGCTLISGEVVPVYDAVLIIFGYHRGMIGWVVLILVAWVFVNWCAAYFALAKFNFLQR